MSHNDSQKSSFKSSSRQVLFTPTFSQKAANRGQNVTKLLILDDFAGNSFVLTILQRNPACNLKKTRNLFTK